MVFRRKEPSVEVVGMMLVLMIIIFALGIFAFHNNGWFYIVFIAFVIGLFVYGLPVLNHIQEMEYTRREYLRQKEQGE